MINVTILNGVSTENPQTEFGIQIGSTMQLFEIANLYFEFYDNKFSLYHNNNILDKTKPLGYYNISEGDIITICDSIDDNEMEELDMLSHSLLYLRATLDVYDIAVMVDTGAQVSIITSKLARSLGMFSKINSNFKGVARGVGSAKIFGIVPNFTLKINDDTITTVSLRVIENESEDCLIFGLDTLIKHHCKIDIISRKISWDGKMLNFLNENDCEKYDTLVINEKEQQIYVGNVY